MWLTGKVSESQGILFWKTCRNPENRKNCWVIPIDNALKVCAVRCKWRAAGGGTIPWPPVWWGNENARCRDSGALGVRSPCFKVDINKLENFQRRFTKTCLPKMSYEKKLFILGLYNSRASTNRDWSYYMLLKLLSGELDIDRDSFFCYKQNSD